MKKSHNNVKKSGDEGTRLLAESEDKIMQNWCLELLKIGCFSFKKPIRDNLPV